MKKPNEMTHRARLLRTNPTSSEAKLWNELRKCQLKGFKFRRQHVIKKYILDFYCKEKKLAIEVDGSVHLRNRGYDFLRTRALANLGIRVVRVTNEQVNKNVKSVVAKISESLTTEFSQSPPPFTGEVRRGT